MKYQLNSTERELIVNLVVKAHTIMLRLEDLADQLELDSTEQKTIQLTALHAHSLMTSISNCLIY